MHTAIRTWRLRSSRAHSDRKPAVEVQRRPLPQKLAKRFAKSWQGGSGHGSGHGWFMTMIYLLKVMISPSYVSLPEVNVVNNH